MQTRIINYMLPDEVNGDHASRLAREYGVEMRIVPRLGCASEPGAAALYDGDSHPEPQAVLRELSSGPIACAVAIHGYRLDDETAADLRAKGVIVSTHLEDAFQGLVRAIAADRDAVACGSEVPAIFAEVRAVAAESYRQKKGHEGDGQDGSEERARLEARIDQLQHQLEALNRDHQLRLDELMRWLDNLRRLVQAHGQ
jgi:hypothetical protein